MLNFSITPHVNDLTLRPSCISHFSQNASLHTAPFIISLKDEHEIKEINQRTHLTTKADVCFQQVAQVNK